MKMLSEVIGNSKITKKQRTSIVGMHDKNIRNNVSVKSSSLHSKGFLAFAPRQRGAAVVCKHLLCLPHAVGDKRENDGAEEGRLPDTDIRSAARGGRVNAQHVATI